MPGQTVSFGNLGVPNDYQSEALAIERRRRLAEALQQQSQTPLDTNQMAGGWAIPISPFQGFAKLAQAGSAAYGQKKATEEEKALSQRYQDDLAKTLTNAMQAQAGTPERPAALDPQEIQQSADQGTPLQTTMPAVAGSRDKMIQALMMHPATQPLAMAQMQADLQRQAFMSAGGMGQPSPTGAPAGNVAAPGANPTPSGQPASPQQMPGFGGPAGGQPMAVWLQTDPSGKAYIEQLAKDYAEGQKPVVNRGFGVGRMVGGQYVPDPASSTQAATTAGGVAGAQEQARFPYRIENVQQAGGGTVPTFASTLPGAPTIPGQQPPPIASPASPTAAPRMPAAATPSPLKGAANDIPPEIPSSTDIAEIDKELKRPGIRPEQRQMLQQQRSQLVADQSWATMPKVTPPQGIGQTTYNRELDTKRAETVSTLSTKFGTEAEAANSRKVLNEQALSLVDKADTGPFAAHIADVKNLLTSRFGVPESSFANTPTATLALQKDLLNAATAKAKAQFGSRMTQSEVMLMLSKGSPNVDMTKEAIKYLINSDNAMANYQIKRATDFGRFVNSQGDPMQFDAWYSSKFPMWNDVKGVHIQNQAAGASPQDVADEMRRRGLIK